MSYGSEDGAQSYIKHLTLDTANNPTRADITQWLAQRSAMLDGWLAVAGYTVPVITPAALVRALDYYANIGAAADAELTQISASYSVDAEGRRENVFLKEFAKAEAWIQSGAPGALGGAQDSTPGPFMGVHISGGGNAPIFRRAQRVADIDADQRGWG